MTSLTWKYTLAFKKGLTVDHNGVQSGRGASRLSNRLSFDRGGTKTFL